MVWKSITKDLISFKQSIMFPITKLWMYFICAKLFPAQHIMEVTCERALLLYVILQHEKINVGDQIYHNMWRCANGHMKGILYPHLITEMC